MSAYAEAVAELRKAIQESALASQQGAPMEEQEALSLRLNKALEAFEKFGG